MVSYVMIGLSSRRDTRNPVQGHAQFRSAQPETSVLRACSSRTYSSNLVAIAIGRDEPTWRQMNERNE